MKQERTLTGLPVFRPETDNDRERIETFIRETSYSASEWIRDYIILMPAYFHWHDFLETGKRPEKIMLEYLRKQLRAGCISYGEIAKLQSLAAYIEPGDVELLEAAGIPEGETPPQIP